MKGLEIKKGVFQDDLRRSIRIHIETKYTNDLKSFLNANCLADEVFYIDLIFRQNAVLIDEYQKIINFNDSSDGEKITPEISDQWYEEKTTRDHYWYYKEYQSFLKERLSQIEKIKIIEDIKKSIRVVEKKANELQIYGTKSNIQKEIINNPNASKSELIHLFSEFFLQGYFKRVDEIVTLIDELQIKMKLCFDETDLKANNIINNLSNFKRSVFNTLETALESLIHNKNYDLLLFEYLNITNKLETELLIEGKSMSDFFKLFYKRFEHIKLNPKPKQPEIETSNTLDLIKSPQDKIQTYLYNEINIELYEDFSICYKTETDLLKFFNKLFIEFEFFCNNINNYVEITDHFVFSEMGYLFWNDENHFNHKTEKEKLFELFNLYECFTKLIQFHFPENKRTGVQIKTCEYIIKLGEKIQKLYLPELQKEVTIKTEPTPAETSKVEKESFINKFDKVHETKIIQYFKKNLVEKKYLTESQLNEYLKQAFELRTPPETKYSFNNIDSIENIVNIFYKYYKDITTESTYGRQKEYFNLLKDYFNGFEKIHLKNFSKQYVFNT